VTQQAMPHAIPFVNKISLNIRTKVKHQQPSIIIKTAAFFLCLFSITAALAQQPLQLVANKKSDYTIVTTNTPTAVETQAAKVLQQYISNITGCSIPIATASQTKTDKQILIGNAQFVLAKDTVGLGGDGVLIKAYKKNLIVGGGWRKGVLYGAYTLVEDYFGCRSYVAKVEVPKAASIQLPASLYVKQKPAFDYRMTWFAEALNKDYCDFHKLNYFMEDWGLWVHSFSKLLPPEKYFATHPEYFALVNGKRVADQPDLTNADVLKIVIDNLRQLIKEKPDARFWSVSQNDNPRYCQCDKCNKINAEQGSPMGAILAFVNAVAKAFPDKTISTLAYQYSETPPKTLVPAGNVMIMLATASQDRRIPVKDQPGAFTDNLKKWSLKTPRLFVWDYVVQFSNALSPFPNLPALQPNIQLFANNKVSYLFEQGLGNIQGEFSQLKCYLLSKLMWNDNINANAIIDSFLNGYYGPVAATYLHQYINLLQTNAAGTKNKVSSGGSSKDARNDYLSQANIDNYKAIFQQALSKVDTSTLYGQRLLKEYTSVLYAEIENDKVDVIAQKKAGKFDKAKYANLVTNWYKMMTQLKLDYLNEIRTKTDDYYQKYMALLNN